VTRDDILSIAYSIGTVGEPWWLDDEDLLAFTRVIATRVSALRQPLTLESERYAAMLRQVLDAIESGQPFDHFDNVIAPAIRERLK
jgi:hypothetical protein